GSSHIPIIQPILGGNTHYQQPPEQTTQACVNSLYSSGRFRACRAFSLAVTQNQSTIRRLLRCDRPIDQVGNAFTLGINQSIIPFCRPAEIPALTPVPPERSRYRSRTSPAHRLQALLKSSS